MLIFYGQCCLNCTFFFFFFFFGGGGEFPEILILRIQKRGCVQSNIHRITQTLSLFFLRQNVNTIFSDTERELV